MDELDRQLKKTLAFKPNTFVMDPESITFIQQLGFHGNRSEWVSRACQFMYEYEHYKKGFLLRMIQENFSLSKHILRQLGRSMK